MTFGELKQETIRLCRFDADEPAATEVGNYVNLALKAASRFTRYLIQIVVRNDVSTQVVDFGNQVVDIEQLWWNGTLLEPETRGWTQKPNVVGTPVRYQSSGSRVILFPAPSSGGTLTARVVALHDTLTNDSQVPAFPEDMHLSLAWYAAGVWLMGYTSHSEETRRAQNLIQMALGVWQLVGQQSQFRGFETQRERLNLPIGGRSEQ